MGESEAEDTLLTKDLERFGGKGQSLHFCAEHRGSTLQDLGEQQPVAGKKVLSWESSSRTHRALARGCAQLSLSTLGAPSGPRQWSLWGPAVMQARTKRH